MFRVEIVVWTLAMSALVWPAAAKAQYRSSGPPVADALVLSIELSREAAALSYEAGVLLCDCRSYNSVLHELRDLHDEMEDLNRTLRASAYRTSQWRWVCRRAEDVELEICELADDLAIVLNELNRVERRRSFYTSVYRLPAAYPPHLQPTLESSPTWVLAARLERMAALASQIHALGHVR